MRTPPVTQGQPQNTPNVFYNNVVRHFDPSFAAHGRQLFGFAQRRFPNIGSTTLCMTGRVKSDIAGPPIYGCSNTGTQKMFNNTLAGGRQPCHLRPNNTHGQHLTVLNEHLIATSWTVRDAQGTEIPAMFR